MRSRKGMSLSYVVPRSIKGIEVRFHISHMRKRKGDLCLVFAFVLAARTRKVGLSFWLYQRMSGSTHRNERLLRPCYEAKEARRALLMIECMQNMV